MAGFFECIGRTPFGSLLAFIMVIVGAAVFCGTLYRALTLVIEGILVQLFGFTLAWLEIVQIMFVVIGVVMGVFTILLLVFAFLATGSTRQNIYSGAKCIMGGRISAGFFIFISYILSMAWIAISCIAMIPVLLYIATYGICEREIYSHTAQELTDMSYCFNLTRFGFYRSAEGQDPDSGSDRLCEHSELRTMCNRVTEAGPLFVVAFASAIIVLLGMIIFLICLAANYTRIKISKELTQYRDAVEMEDLDVNTHYDPQKGPPPYLISSRSSTS
ncbi:proteolipid protein DM beta-like [Littorina saxatilis]|uniref:Neuronal membrane glycoprotein M6-b n=1 Tax=Littorina saxatilis TaxID=31220 RepID=A0AAN9G633_9CAEN